MRVKCTKVMVVEVLKRANCIPDFGIIAGRENRDNAAASVGAGSSLAGQRNIKISRKRVVRGRICEGGIRHGAGNECGEEQICRGRVCVRRWRPHGSGDIAPRDTEKIQILKNKASPCRSWVWVTRYEDGTEIKSWKGHRERTKIGSPRCLKAVHAGRQSK
jgi:hypothetical protein